MPIPIPPKHVGAFFGNHSAARQMEVFVDIQCPFSAKAWPTILNIMSHYGPNKIGVSIKMMVLANHRQSFDISRALTAVAENDDERYIDFATYLFERQASFNNSTFSQKTHNDLILLCANHANEFDGREPTTFLELMETDIVYASTKYPFREAALKGVWSTPTFFLNNSELISLDSSSSLNDWREILDSLN